MKAKVDSVGRILIPKSLREQAGIDPGATVDIFVYGDGVQVTPQRKTATLVEEDGLLVATGNDRLTDEMMYALIDEGRNRHTW